MTNHIKTDLIKASVEYVRAGFIDRDTPNRKVKIAMCVAILMADDRAGNEFELTKAIGDRFRGWDDFDRNVMTKIFNFSMVNDRVLVLLDIAMVLKKNNIHWDIDHELCVFLISSFSSTLWETLYAADSL